MELCLQLGCTAPHRNFPFDALPLRWDLDQNQKSLFQASLAHSSSAITELCFVKWRLSPIQSCNTWLKFCFRKKWPWSLEEFSIARVLHLSSHVYLLNHPLLTTLPDRQTSNQICHDSMLAFLHIQRGSNSGGLHKTILEYLIMQTVSTFHLSPWNSG